MTALSTRNEAELPVPPLGGLTGDGATLCADSTGRHRVHAPNADLNPALLHWRQLIADGQFSEAWACAAAIRPQAQSAAALLRCQALELQLRLSESLTVAPEMLRLARLLGQQAQDLGDPEASAECLYTEGLCYRNARLYGEALQSVERARSLYDCLNEHTQALSMQVLQATVYYAASMFERLTVFGEALIPEAQALRPEERHALLSCVASAYFYLLESEWRPEWQARCVNLNEQALAVAQSHGLRTAACLSHLNLSLNCAVRGQVDKARQHLRDAHEAQGERGMRSRLHYAQPFIEAICLFHEGQIDAAFDGLDLAAARASDITVARHLNNILNTKVRLARQAGRTEVALDAARRLQSLDQDMSEEHIRLLVSDFTTHAAMAQVHADHEALLRHGDALERSLATRNLELSSALARVQSEMELRRATEAALQSAHDELEQKAQARAQNLRDARQLLARQEKLAALSNVGTGLAHELNTPIGNARLVATALHDKSSQLQAQLAEGTLRRTSLHDLAHELDGGVQLLDQALSRLQHWVAALQGDSEGAPSFAHQAFDAVPLAHGVLHRLQTKARTRGVTLTLDAPEQCACTGDPQAFVDVLQALIDNALRHGLEGRHSGQVRISLNLRTRHAELTVTDNGRGVPIAHAQRIFEPFFTTRFGQGSSGLGLHRAQQLVQQRLRGELQLSAPSDPELGGASFVLHLPLEGTGNSSDRHAHEQRP